MGENYQRPAARILRLEYWRSGIWWWWHIMVLVKVKGRKDRETVLLRSRRYEREEDVLSDCRLLKGARDVQIVKIGD